MIIVINVSCKLLVAAGELLVANRSVTVSVMAAVIPLLQLLETLPAATKRQI
jgi:hypothetical protein